jgi:HSP20 family molecular chaperone IbpA
MKRDANSPAQTSRRNHAARPAGSRGRKCIVLGDLTDCLLEAYECVARRAFEKYVERGGEPGGELDDWLSAERELLQPIAVDFEECDEYVHALASSPCFANADVEVSIEPRWIAILATASPDDGFADRADARSTDSASQARSSSDGANRSAEFSAAPADGKAASPAGPQGALRGSAADPADGSAYSQAFCIVQLPAEVVPKASIAILGDGVIGIRMPKAVKQPKHTPVESPANLALR